MALKKVIRAIDHSAAVIIERMRLILHERYRPRRRAAGVGLTRSRRASLREGSGRFGQPAGVDARYRRAFGPEDPLR